MAPDRTPGSELLIVDNSDKDWKVADYLRDWCELAEATDIATAYFEIGALLKLDGEWQKVDRLRVLMGDEVSKRTRDAFVQGLRRIEARLDESLEADAILIDEAHHFRIPIIAGCVAMGSGHEEEGGGVA